ncbi:MAG TPA: hypothetical protein VNO79_11945, partial [Actinomycetota bacterium]|nr:hypothetical protein [Actinomycetota bacterium]
ICPACGYREQAPDADGFCRPCAERRVVERYLENQGRAAAARNAAWRERTARARTAAQAPDHLRERQHYSRLRRAVRPRRPPWPSADPWELGAEALATINRLREMAVSQDALAALEDLAELVRWLAWGPDPEGER